MPKTQTKTKTNFNQQIKNINLFILSIMKTIKKQQYRMFGKEVYLIGINEDGEKVFLEEPSWDCGWYWGFGYLETYTNNRQITRSRDIQSHSHFQDFDENSSLNPYHVLTDCVLSFEELQILKGLVRQAKQLGEEARGAKEREYKNITDIHEQCISMLRPLR